MDSAPFAKLLAYFKEHSAFLLSLWIIAILVYGFELFHFNLSIDDEDRAYLENVPTAFIAVGRWGMYLLNYLLLPYTPVPIIPLALALFCMILAIVLILQSWHPDVGTEHYLAGALALSFPTLPYIMAFSAVNYGIGVGLLSIAYGFRLFLIKRPLPLIGATLFFTFAIAIYQSLLLVLFSIFVVWLISNSLSNDTYKLKPLLRDTWLFCLIVLGAAIIYAVFNKFFLYLFHVKMIYITTFVRLNQLFEDPLTILLRTGKQAAAAYLGHAQYYINTLHSLKLLSIFSFLFVFWAIIKHNRPFAEKAVLVLLLLIVLFLPFTLHLMNSGLMPTRSLLSLPVALVGLTFLAFKVAPAFVRSTMILLSVFVIFQFSVIANRHFNATNIALEADRELAGNILERFHNLRATANTPIVYLEVVGVPDWPKNQLTLQDDIFGASFFTWDQGNPVRVIAFLRSLGLPSLAVVPRDRQSELVPIARQLPNWPNDGSVALIDDVLVIKFGPHSEGQKRRICGKTKIADFCS